MVSARLQPRAPAPRMADEIVAAVPLQSFREVHRVLKAGGTFFICNESNGDTNKDDKWIEKIGGMTIHNGTKIKTVLDQAGFFNIHIEKNVKGWICVTAEK